MATSAMTPTNTRAISYWPRAKLIKKPRPRSAPTNSPTTAPMTDSVAPILSPPSQNGTEGLPGRARQRQDKSREMIEAHYGLPAGQGGQAGQRQRQPAPQRARAQRRILMG